MGIEHENTQEIVCPHCGYTETESWDYNDAGDTECNSCGEKFHYERNIYVDYITE